MSFADELRRNYEGPKPPSKNLYIKEIVKAAKDAACRESRNAKSLSGYFTQDFDEYDVGEGEVQLFMYQTKLGYKDAMVKGFWPNIEQCMFTPQERSCIVENVRQALEKEGFATVIVRAEDTHRLVKYGHTEFLHREKKMKIPAFKIFISLTW